MSRILHASYHYEGVNFGKMSGHITVLVDGSVACSLRNLEKANIRLSWHVHTIDVKLDRFLIFKHQIEAGENDWTLALELKGTNIRNARLRYPLYENVPSSGKEETARQLSISYAKDDHDRSLYLYFDGNCIAPLDDAMDRKIDISNDAHAVQVRSRSLLPYLTEKISAGINSWRLIGEGSRFLLEECVPYWIQAVPRKAYADDPEVHAFCGTLPVLQDAHAQIPAVDCKAFTASWSQACPFTAPGEKWVCFEERERIPIACITRFSASEHQVTPYLKNWIDPLSAVSMVRISDRPVPFPDVHRGCWKADLLPISPVGGENAYVYVEYIGHRMYWYYFDEYSVEVGPMGHYEDYPFEYQARHDETEFTSRDQLLQSLMDFIPRNRDNRIDSVPSEHHLSIDAAALRELLSGFFQEETQQ